ncbi:type VI secretion system tube protein Hcp [Acanthopleuribacter pedis]|uniref:Type VI secretion system tube protein Hcp n=1 Tax=Acanthopleuribacter pedis TaxID=442870 RepID=A0A8J7U4G8_9BACT|nr:type VI secretion system tube protein Hcp [Acanthopleuribacter pedis]MBO1321468.1 type VI secretion system tube protein Hcp [Acanthopleuribacter pedis]
MTVYSFINCGAIPGKEAETGHEAHIRVHELHLSSNLPVSELDNKVKSKRSRQPLTYVSEMGKHTPVTFQHLFNNVEIADLEVLFYRPDITNGDMVNYFTIKFKRLKVVYSGITKRNVYLPESDSFPDEHTTKMVYGNVVYSYNEDGIEAEDEVNDH